MVRDLGPNWFAAVMGTGIVANAGAILPLRMPGLRGFATVVWGLAAAMLIGLTAAWAVHWIRYPERARGHARHPVMAHFWGAPAMALMTVGTGTLVLGRSLLGTATAVDADWVLWGAGTALGLVTACWIPFLMITRPGARRRIAGAFGGWLMPVVPPMVSAASGALLVPYAAPGQGRLTLLLTCYAMFGVSLLASVIITARILVPAGRPRGRPAALVPTLSDRARPARPVGHRGGRSGTGGHAGLLGATRRVPPAVCAALWGPGVGLRDDVAPAEPRRSPPGA